VVPAPVDLEEGPLRQGSLEGPDSTLVEDNSSLLESCLQPASDDWIETRSSDSTGCDTAATGGFFLQSSLRPCEEALKVHRLASACEPATPPPIRLRMVSHDSLCARSMEVSWDNATGGRQRWSSWDDQFSSSYVSEKLLPACATNIAVEFKTRARIAGGESFTVYAVDRQRKCHWKTNEHGKYVAEVIRFRSSAVDRHEGVDAVFEMTGPLLHCYVWRAWNAASGVIQDHDDAWECWHDEATRPAPVAPPAALLAADAAASRKEELQSDPHERLQSCTKRLNAAARALLDIRRQTLSDLESLDRRLELHWLAINSTNTLSVGLGAASVAAFFVCPPAGIALGVGSMASGTAAQATDIMSDELYLQMVRAQLAKDAWNAFAVAELELEWLRACDVVGGTAVEGDSSQAISELEKVSVVGSRVVGASATAANAVVHGALPATAKVLGIAGVAISAGIAIHGWANDKALRSALRRKRSELATSMLALLRWLASMRLLECPICNDPLHIGHMAVQCHNSWHCMHASCMQRHMQEASLPAEQRCCCPVCSGKMEIGERVLNDIIESNMRSHLCELCK